jgi:hypothetical protein
MDRRLILKLVSAIQIFSIAMAAAAPSAGSARPGTLNAIAGEVSINGVPVNAISGIPIALEGGVIRTARGMAEILLSPGRVLRLGNASELTLETAGKPGVRVRLRRGEALLEVLDAGGALTVEQNGVTARVRNLGLYEFDQKRSVIAVYAGEAGLNKDGQRLVVNAGFSVGTRRFRVFPASPDRGNALFAWSRSRSEQLSSESRASAQDNTGAARSPGPQWHWDPWSASYTFLSASGFVTGPFGWPYFSPGYAPDSIPVHRGDSWLYGPPVLSSPDRPGGFGPARPIEPQRGNVTPTVPLTAPGEPQFPNNR